MANYSYTRKEYKQVCKRIIFLQSVLFFVLPALHAVISVTNLILGLILSERTSLTIALLAFLMILLLLFIYAIAFYARLKMTMEYFDDWYKDGVANYSIEILGQSVVRISASSGKVFVINDYEIIKMRQYKNFKILKTKQQNYIIAINEETATVVSIIENMIN